MKQTNRRLLPISDTDLDAATGGNSSHEFDANLGIKRGDSNIGFTTKEKTSSSDYKQCLDLAREMKWSAKDVRETCGTPPKKSP